MLARTGERVGDGCTGSAAGAARRDSQALLEALLALGEYANAHSLEALLTRTLDEVERLTGSSIGFFHFVSADERELSLQAWSTNTVTTMCAAQGERLHYPVDRAGVWVDCLRERRAVIHNDYAALAHRRGMPAGHAPVVRELLVPVVRGGAIAAILGTGNKPSDYDAQDVEVVSWLANLAWDIVQHKRAAEALRARERDLAKAQEVAHVGSWKLDPRSGELSWSDEVFRIFGLAPGALQPSFEHFLQHVHPEDREAVRASYEQAVRERERYEIVHRVVRPDGEVRVVRERSEEVRDAAGAAVASFGTVLDITELARVEAELRQLNAELEQRVARRTAELARINDEKNELLGMAVHDLRNPLAVVQGYVALLAEGLLGELRPAQVEILGRIRGSTQFMLKLIDDLLAVSRIDAGRLELRCAEEELRPLLEEVVEANRIVASSKQIAVELGEVAPLPPLVCDRFRLEQVLTNLVSNAIKFSESGTHVELGARRVDENVVIHVQDEGCGIDPRQLPHLFVAFGSAGASGTAGERSTGLGLAIARRMVEAHGGRIWAESRLGEGSRFCVALPLPARAPG